MAYFQYRRRVHVFVNLWAGAWPPCCATPPPRLHHRRRAYAPTSNTASHDTHEKINSWVSFVPLYGYGAPLGGLRPPELRYNNTRLNFCQNVSSFSNTKLQHLKESTNCFSSNSAPLRNDWILVNTFSYVMNANFDNSIFAFEILYLGEHFQSEFQEQSGSV